MIVVRRRGTTAAFEVTHHPITGSVLVDDAGGLTDVEGGLERKPFHPPSPARLQRRVLELTILLAPGATYKLYDKRLWHLFKAHKRG